MSDIFEVYEPKAAKIARRRSQPKIYFLKVYPENEPERHRIIEIRAGQSLNDLRRILEPAFGRDPYGFICGAVTRDNEIDIQCYGSIGQDDRKVVIGDCFSAGDRFTYVLFPAPGKDRLHIVDVLDVRREGVNSRESPEGSGKSSSKNVSPKGRRRLEKVYTFKVYLGQKLKKRPRAPWRLIAVRGDQTLEDLHDAIYEAFDRWDAHLYAFYIGDEEYTVPQEEQGPMGLFRQLTGGAPEKDAAKAAINRLGLSVGDWFTYLFDFGDEWWHVAELVGVEERESDGTVYPVVVEKRGQSPEQYPDSGDEWDE
ncbi:MAG: hypothetical protein M0Z41_11350 [Peptococcaceae bacterium]|nr:hypothetical protein [Peptococcaceae bacterium]